MERQESRHLAAQEAQPGNRSLRADQSRTIAQQSYLEEAQKAARVVDFKRQYIYIFYFILHLDNNLPSLLS